MDLAWWISIIAVPLVGAVFGTIGLVHARATSSSAKCHERIDALASGLAEYKLVAADKFATQSQASAIETRIAGTLERIDTKLDKLDERLTRQQMRGAGS